MEPSKGLITEVRIGFIRKGMTLRRWCVENKLSPQNVRMALMGAWDGPKAREVRARAIEAAGVAEQTRAAA